MTQDKGQWRTLANTEANLGKGKVRPRTGLEGPEGERYSSTLSLTSALYGVGGQRHALAALPPGKKPSTHCTGGWWGPGPVLTGAENLAAHWDPIPGPFTP